jgi:hypothetical protein
MPVQNDSPSDRQWGSWYFGALLLTIIPIVFLLLTFVTPRGPEWWVWFVDAAPTWLMWIVRALLLGWVVAAWKFQTRPLLIDTRRRREECKESGGWPSNW